MDVDGRHVSIIGDDGVTDGVSGGPTMVTIPPAGSAGDGLEPVEKLLSAVMVRQGDVRKSSSFSAASPSPLPPSSVQHDDDDDDSNDTSNSMKKRRRSFLNLALLGRSNSNASKSKSSDDDDDDEEEEDAGARAEGEGGDIQQQDDERHEQLVGHVQFAEHAYVRSYVQVLGDHPYCLTGCPIQLGWSYEEGQEEVVDRSDQVHQPLDTLRLTHEQRKYILLLHATRRANSRGGNSERTSTSLSPDGSSEDEGKDCDGSDEDQEELQELFDDDDDPVLTASLSPSSKAFSNLVIAERDLDRECRRLNRARQTSSRRKRQVQREFFMNA
jgi:hypothetical protein